MIIENPSEARQSAVDFADELLQSPLTFNLHPREQFQIPRNGVQALGQSVEFLFRCHGRTVYAALRSVKNFIERVFIGLQSAAYPSVN